MTHISKLLGFLPTIRLRIDRFDGEIISHDLAFTLKGLEIEVNPQSGVVAKIRVGELQLHDTRNHSLIVALSVLIVKAQFGGENSFDVSLNSANVNINGLCESSVVECLYLAAAAQSFSPKCHRAMFAARWQTLDQQLREIEQIKIDRQVKWRGDNVDDDLFFYDAATVVSELSAAPNVIVRVGLVVLEASTGNRSEEDISIESIKFESTSTIQRSPESSVQSIRTTIEIRHIFNGTEIHPHVDELLTVESQVTKTINHMASSPLQVSSSHNIALGDLTLGISATFLRGILTLLDDVKFLGGRRGAASIPARPAAALMEHDSQSDLSTGSINILIKSDEMNGPNNLQQNVLVRLGHISKYATAHRSSIVLESLQVYLGNYDVDIQSVDGMMLYGNAIIALKTLTISLPNATDGAHYHPRSTDVTFADWIQTVYEKKGANLITEVTIKSIAVSVSQADIVSLAFLSKSICKYGTGNALNVYSSLRVHAYRVEPSCKRTTVVTIGDIVVNVATENPLQRYRILRNKQLILKLASIGTWWSSTSFLLSDDVEVMYTDGTRGGSDRLLAKIWAVTKEDGRKEAIAFTQTSSFAELHSPAHSATGVGFRMGTTSLRIPKISVVVDVEDIKPLLVIKAACQTCYPDAESRVISPREALYQPQVLFVTKTPSSVFLFENKQLKVDMYHTADRLRLPAVELTTSSLDIAQVDFAGCSSQLSIGITNLRLSEMSHPKVPHKVIIDSVEHGTFTNKFSMHITSVKGENGIFEMQAEHVRVMYLQRATMTLVTFFRDHFFGAMGEVSAHIPPKPLTTLIAPAKGMYRVCIVVRRSEFHMPSSSAGSDSLVVFFRRLVFYRTTDEYEKKLPAYIRGPYQSRKLLLSELPQVRKLIQNLADRKRSAGVDLHTTWKLPVYLHELMFTADEPPVSEGYLKLQLYEGSITSWCNSNLICTAMDAMATIKINPSIPNAEEPYETFDGDAYLMPAYTMRNTIVVEVFAEEIDWVMAQGQYWLIVNSIQQNFMEWNYHIIDPFILPIFKKVELGERIFGKDPFNRALPIASSVPVHIRKGSIIAAENDQDFLKNFLAFLPALEAFDDSFHHNFDKEIKTTVPSESPFHRFRDPLFSRWTRSEAKREKLREYHHGLETPFALKFENLFLDFYRFHFGGGNGIEASATTLVAQQQARSEYVNEGVRAQTGSSFDDTDIRDLVLAPRHLSVFHSKEPHRSKYSAAEAPSSTAAAATAAAATEDSTKEAAEAAARHIRYSQQGVANVRRCCVYVDDTVVAVNVTTMLAIVDFFVIPIQLTSQRNLQLVDQLNKGPFDYRGGLDVEVHMDRSYVCIPDPVNGINALCFDLKVDFAQSLRGFLNVGPGLALMDLDIDINNIFMAPLNEVNDIFMKPLVDPVKFRFLNEYTVLAPKETLAKHLDALNSWSTFSSWVTELPNRYDRASGQRIMRFFIEPLINPNDDLDDEGSTFLGRVEEPKSKVIRGQCSIKDLMFILSVVNGIRKSLKRRLQNLPKGDIYRNILLTIDDLKHQMSLDEQLVCVPWAYDLNVDVKEVHAQLSNFDFHVRNNTYNVNIGRLKLEDIIIIYARGPDHMHMATEVRLDAWTFNDDMDDWEPFIEPIQLRAIGATDSSRGIDEANDPDSAEDATPSIRIDVITDGLEVNLQQQALTSLIRKVRLGDVLTTSSNRLPPYMIINELGVHCKFTIGIQSTIVLASEIHAAASYPVEVSRLADSLNTFKRQRAYQTYGDDNGGLSDMDVREYFIWISFPNFSHSYESKAALCIDKVGVHPFEMQMLKGGGKRDSQAFRKSADTAVDSQGNPEPMRYAQELPYAILDMRIKEDGVRELHLRGWLSFKNTTSRLMQISLRLYGSCFDSSLAPGKEWHAPVRYANPKAQLFIRFDHKSDWIEALPYLGMIIAGGSWGCPTKLRARLCKCYREHDDPETTEEPKWLLLVRPEAKSTKSIGLGASNTSATKASSIVVKYPNRDNNTKTKFGVGQMMDEGPDSFQIDDTQLASVISGTVTGFSASFLSVDQSQIRPVCINLQAPLQFCSFLPQPLLYRLIDQEGTYCASGILLPGQTIDIHNITQIFQRRLMVSVRMLNYAWSEYVVVFGRSNPFSNAEKSSELVLQSLLFQSPHTGKEFLLPQLSLTMVIKEFFVRFTCQVVLSNYTGQELLFAESSNPELYVPLGSVASVRDYLDANVPAKRKSLHSRAFVRRSYVNYTADNYVDSDDEEGSHESASDDGQHSAHRVSEIASSSSAPLMPPPPSLTGRLSPTPMGGGGGMFAEPGTNSRFKQIMNLKIHLPQDHQKVIEVVASSSWTLDDLFMDIKHRVDNHGLELFASDFKFFPWIIDEKTVTAKNIQAVEDGEDDVKAAAQVRPISQNINIGNEMPLSMRFDLVMVLNNEPWNMRTPLAALNTFEMLLCHDAEVSIYRQVASIRGESISKEGIKAFFGKTRYVYKAQIARVTGEIPFKPYRMLGNPLLSISVPTETDWSAGVDVIKGEFDMGEMVITLANKRVTDTPYNPMYEFGVHLERGTGFMQQSTVATVVPKHILVSRLSYPIDIRQLDFDYAPSIVFLEPNSSCNFHYPNRTRPRQLQVKRSPIAAFHREDADDSPPQSQRKQQQQQQQAPRLSEEDLLAMETWVGEIDVNKLGIVFVRLRHPLAIIKVETEVVGGSLVSTFSEQSLIWPPYRIDNKSNASVRFREEAAPMSNTAAAAAAAADLLSNLLPEQARVMMEESMSMRDGALSSASTREMSRTMSASGAMQPSAGAAAAAAPSSSSTSPVRPAASVAAVSSTAALNAAMQWDDIEAKGSFPYTWDHPFSGNRTIRLEVSAAGQTATKLVKLDDDIKDLTVTLKKKVPNLGNPLAEGYLTRCEPNNDREVYCILRPDILYVYEKDELDPSKHELLDVINLSKIKKSGKFILGSIARMTPDKGGKDFLSNTFTDFFSNISSTVNFIRQKTKMKFDLNYLRTLMLTLGDHLGYFTSYALDNKVATTRRRTYSDEHDIGLPLSHASRSANVSTESLDELSSHSGSLPGLAVEDNSDQASTTNGGGSSSKNLRLKELLSAGASSQDLMDELQKHVVYTHQVIDAILASNDKYTPESAKELCAWLILHEYLIPYNPEECIRSFSFDGSMSARPSVFDASFLTGDVTGGPATVNTNGGGGGGGTAAPIMPGMAMPTDTRPTLSGPSTSTSSGASTSSTRPTATLLGMARASKAMQYYNTLLNDCDNMEMVFVPPPLNPEMLELQMSLLDDRGRATVANTAANASASSRGAPDEVFGFTLTVNDKTFSFKCSSGDEFRGWMQSARLAIELGWVDYMTGRKPLTAPKISDYQITYHLKTRADGSTKVLEITEVGGGQDERGKKIVKRVTSTLVDAFSFLPVFRRDKRALQASNLEELKESIDADRALISVYFNVRSVSLSIIDAAPSEVMYIRLQDVVMNVIRYLRAVQFTVTVRQLQFVDQLLNPSFPVTLFTRKLSPEEAKKIVLPGFEDGEVFGYPSLHLHLQQRYFKSAKNKAGAAAGAGGGGGGGNANGAGGGGGGGGKANASAEAPTISPANTSESKLWYFDVFTIWLAPMHLGVDEEIFVRLFRFIQSVRTTLVELEAGGKTRKVHEDAVGSSSADYRLLSTDLDRHALHANYMQLVESGRSPYALFATETKRALNMYFGLLQLYPLEVSISFRPSPDVKLTNAEYAIVSIIAQLDNAKIKLNSLFAENAFGSTVIIKEIVAKHYRAAFWKQFRNLIGATDIVEGSVGLVANLGTGVYDLFNESVEGLNPNEKKSFLHGLSRGGMSLASHTIGGTSGFTSRIAGGIGKGVSMLTLDTEFQRNRTYRKYNQANTLSEGLYVGTQELGRNIVEGVTGIVVSPYRGWEQGGGVGLATGMARGILGVALKPAVGVLDLASRATEGLRNTTMQAEIGISAEIEGIRRCRIPRAFGRSGILQIYDVRAAAAQCMADYLADFRYDPRLQVVAHLYCRRKIETVRGMTRSGAAAAAAAHQNHSPHDHATTAAATHRLRPQSSTYAPTILVGEPVEDDVEGVPQEHHHEHGGHHPHAHGHHRPSSFGRAKTMSSSGYGGSSYGRRYEESAARDFTLNPPREAWGLPECTEYVILVTPDRVALVEVNSTVSTATAATASTVGAPSGPAPSIADVDFDGDNDAMSVSSRTTTASTIAPSVVSTASGLPPTGSSSGGGGGMFGAFRSKTKKLTSMGSSSSVTAGIAGNSGATTASGASSTLPPSGISPSSGGSGGNGGGGGGGPASVSVVTSLPSSANKRCRFIWVCPANCIDELSSDNRGDMQLKLNTSLLLSGAWHQRLPTILDPTLRNFTVFQSLLEQVMGVSLARQQPLHPPYRVASSGPPRVGGLLQQGIRKKYSTGIRSVLMSPSVHTYWVYGHVLYEYTAVRGSAAAANAAKHGIASSGGSAKQLVPTAATAAAAAPPAAAGSELSDYFHIENAVDDQLSPEAAGSSSRPTSGFFGNEAAAAAAAAGGPPALSSSSSVTFAASGPNTFNSGATASPATNAAAAAAANNAKSPLDDLMEKTIAAIAVTPTKYDRLDGDGDDGSVRPRQRRRRSSGSKQRRQKRSDTADGASSSMPPPPGESPEKDSDDDDEAYDRHRQQQRELQQTQQQLFPTETAPLTRERRSSSAGSLSDMSAVSQASLSSVSTAAGPVVQPPELQDQYLSFVYPLVDLTMHGPTPEEGGKFYSISIQRMDNAKLRCLRRDDPNEALSEYMKSGLSLLFPTKELAMNWRLAIESRITLRPTDCLPPGLLTTEDKKREYGRFLPLSSRNNVAANGEKQTLESVMTPVDNSVLGVMILPTSGCAEKETETIKIEIFKTLSAVRR